MANDLLDKIQDTEKAISDKEKESIGLEEKHQKSEAEFNFLLTQNQSAIANLQERKYRLGRAQYDDANVREKLIVFGLNSTDAALADSSLIVKESNNSLDHKTIDALLVLDKASRGKEISTANSSEEKLTDNSDVKEEMEESRDNVASQIGRDKMLEELRSMTSLGTTTDQTIKKKVFISHASKDILAVKHIVELLELIGFDKSNMFCSSIEPYGIPTGMDIYEYLQKQFRDFELHVILVLSNNYYNSIACLNEMGAAWVLSCSQTVMLLPGFSFSDIDGAINPRKIAIQFRPGMNDTDLYNMKSRIDGFIEEMAQLSSNKPNKPHIREEKRDGFINAMNTYTDNTVT